MSKQNKWAGNMGKVASGGQKNTGGNTYQPVPKPSAPRASSSTSNNVIKMPTGPGDNMGTQSISSHNNINAFTRGIKSRGPYGGPTFASLNHYEQKAKSSNTQSISNEQKSPSSQGSRGGSSRGTTGGSGTGMTKNSKVGSGSAKMTTKVSSSKSNKDGSGYMASVK